jgi:hypothetical protein
MERVVGSPERQDELRRRRPERGKLFYGEEYEQRLFQIYGGLLG